MISGAIYVPFEVYALVSHPGWKPLALLIGNLIVVFYVTSILVENRRARLGSWRDAKSSGISE